MEKMKNVKKVIFPIMILIIMIGAIVTATVGFNFGLMYESHKRIEVFIDKDYSINDLNDFMKSEFKNEKIIMQDVENFDKDVSFIVKSISSKKVKNLETKIREKYEIDEKTENVISVVNVPHTKLRDIIKPYVKPLIIASVILFVYLAIRFRKLGILNVGLITVASIIIMQALYFSILAICRIPISKLTMPISLLIYILTILSLTLYFSKKRENQD